MMVLLLENFACAKFPESQTLAKIYKFIVFYLVSVAVQTDMSLSWLEAPKTGFLAFKPT